MSRTLLVTLGLVALASLVPSAQRATPVKPSPPRRAPAPAPPRIERPTPFKVGEMLTYDVSWSTYLTAGTVVTTVKEKKPSYNSTAYYIVAEGRPTLLLSKLYTLYYKMDTLIDAYTLLSQRGSIYSEEGSRHRFRTTMFDRGSQKASFEYRTATIVKADFAIPPYVQDGLSALYVIRAIPLKAGDRMTMPVSDNGTNYRVQFDIAAPERVKIPLGDTNAWKLKSTIYDAANRAVGRNLAIWLSADPRQLPVKLQAELPVGSFVLSLRDAK